MQINFYPTKTEARYVEATTEYQTIWQTRGTAFLNAHEARTALSFPDIEINALVYEGPSQSRPLLLRASDANHIKAATLVHELGHILIAANAFPALPGVDAHIYIHKLLYLFLYDVYLELFGQEMTNTIVAWESGVRESHQTCWQWALALSSEERARRFAIAKEHRETWSDYVEAGT